MKYDIIGDIHGYADELEALLKGLKYRKDENGVYAPPGEPGRQAIFVGDFIDRGPEQFRVLNIVRGMVDAGYAQATMGNHEFNAGMYHTHVEKDGELIPLRPHDEKNRHQHQAFLKALDDGPAQGRSHIEWFKNLPLYLELDGLRVVHALWDEDAIRLLHDRKVVDEKGRIRPDQWERLLDYKTGPGRAAELLTKGIEVDLPPGVSFVDGDGIDGIKRHKARLKWWGNPDDPDLTLDKVMLDVPDGKIPPVPVSDDRKAVMRKAQLGDDTIFFGHYCQKGECPAWEPTQRAICVDRGVTKDGHLVAATVLVEEGKIKHVNYTYVKSVSKAASAPEARLYR